MASRDQIARLEWFGDVVVSAGFERLDNFFLDVCADYQKDPDWLSSCANLIAQFGGRDAG